MASTVALRSLVVAVLFTLTASTALHEDRIVASTPREIICNNGHNGLSLLQKGHRMVKQQGVKHRKLGFHLGPQNARQEKIVDMMKHTWKGYEKHCWGGDELRPLDGGCLNTWHLGLTLVDSLDTLYLMGLKHQFNSARDWVANRTALNFDKVGRVSLFETTIRVMGGLLGAHALSGDRIFLERAHEIGDHLLPGFVGLEVEGPPTTDVDLHLGRAASLRDPFIAESTSLGLEFKTLAKLTGLQKYAKAVESVSRAIHKQPKLDGVAMNQIDARSGKLYGPYKLGAGGDSYYEYLLKQWLLTGRKDSSFLQDYKKAVKGIQLHLVNKTRGPLHLTYVGELSADGTTLDRKMDHLVCFLPGTLALGVHYGADNTGHAASHMQLAKELMRTCYQMYNVTGRMLAPEIAKFDTEGQELFIERGDSHDLLRPETVESLFYLYRLTGDKKYQDWGWQIAQGIERWAKVKNGGYASLDSVLEKHPDQRNHMESFFPAETLKYLFLLFDDSGTQVPLDEFVFNTEAHPLRIIADDHLHARTKEI